MSERTPTPEQMLAELNRLDEPDRRKAIAVIKALHETRHKRPRTEDDFVQLLCNVDSDFDDFAREIYRECFAA